MPVTEIIGYSGSVLVAISLMMSNLKLLRWINLFGAIMFSLYGFLLGAIPVFLLNAFIAIADMYYLRKLSARFENFSYIQIQNTSDPYLSEFLKFYEKDIRKYFPAFSLDAVKNPFCFFTLRDMVPAGLFIYESMNDGTVEVKLDYVIPQYRDLKNSRYMYAERAAQLKAQGYRYFTATSSVEEHNRYLKKIGFEKKKGSENSFTKEI
ncbi:MAG: hypothetical protein ACM3SM_14560 [Bacteroidota bacterium]